MSSTSNIMLHQQPRGRHVAHLEYYATPTGWRETSSASNTMLHLQAGGRHVAHLEHYATPTAWRETYRQPQTLCYIYSLEVDKPSTSNIMLHLQPRG